MNEQDEKHPSQGKIEETLPRVETPIDRWHFEAPEIEGWALQWDTTALRKANLARKMRGLRQSSGDL